MLHRLFRLSVLVKGIHAIIDIIGAFGIYFTSTTTIYSIVQSAVANELVEDPNDILVNFVLNKTQHISQSTHDFAALYLFMSGIANLILISGLLLQKPRAYPVAIALTLIFVAYQMYMFLHTFSPWILVVTLYDCILVGLIYFEYRRISRRIPENI